MKSKGILAMGGLDRGVPGQKKKRPQEGGVGPKILSSGGLIRKTIVTDNALVKHFLGGER